MGEKPKFYCETCGREVPVDVDECPYCGMRFYGVMCPRCGMSGPAEIFENGCPRCGYRSFREKRSIREKSGGANVPVRGKGFEKGGLRVDQDIRPNSEDGPPPARRTSLWAPFLAILLLATLGAAAVVVLLK
jgi:DNA-directed RNA polymerase subunit RPC12/RpoP